MSHEELLEKAIDAAKELHADQTVPMEKTLSSLRELEGIVSDLATAVECDLEDRQ